MLESGKWAITVTELEPGEFHYTVLEAVAFDGDLFVFRPTILSDDAHKSPVGAWIAGVCELVNSAAETISLPLANMTSGARGSLRSRDQGTIESRDS